MLCKAWELTQVFWNGKHIFFNRDYPKKILKKLKYYTEVKRVLRQSNT